MSRAPSNILDRPLGGRGRNSSTETAVSQSAFAYLYSELVQYHQSRVASISELERRLESSGYGIGLKVLELLSYRSREVSAVTLLKMFLTNILVWDEMILRDFKTIKVKNCIAKPPQSLTFLSYSQSGKLV
mmetsp:Transcript_20339/g.30198  ORF Transcript_20339/g.30198 Transcript_20339/m.30198 type:complete len:131 (-) Transcript_20339:1732-2124(-)